MSNVYVQHPAINGGKELLLNTVPGVVELSVSPTDLSDPDVTEVVLKAQGEGLLDAFQDIETGPRKDLVWVRIGEWRRAGWPTRHRRPGAFRIGGRLVAPGEQEVRIHLYGCPDRFQA